MSKIRTFVVLGMHRSGTSLLAGGLHKMGVHMGEELLGASESNPAGHFENVEFVRLNDKILEAAGGSWDNPPERWKILAQRKVFKDKIRETVERNERELWGWKDPRTILTIDLYLPYLKNPFFYFTMRKPEDVARSLVERDGGSYSLYLALAKEYNSRLYRFLRKMNLL